MKRRFGRNHWHELPDSDRNILALVSVSINNWWLDLSYNHLLFSDREIAARPNDGVLASNVQDGMAYIAGLSFGYKW
jgi:long-subunit fatty acid transport protein